jgi:hypothetical protein
MIEKSRLSASAKAAAIVVGAVVVVSAISAEAAVSFSDGARDTIAELTTQVSPRFVGKDPSDGVARWMEAQDTRQGQQERTMSKKAAKRK